MENLLESNERTLVIFDAVCSGLAECLDLVHQDIKQMTEHRNRLAQQVEHERQQQQNLKLQEGSYTPEAKGDSDTDRTFVQTDLDVTDSSANVTSASGASPKVQPGAQDDDPHHLARLKLLDKRLADSFSQALSMCDQQKSSLAKQRHEQRVVAAAATNAANEHQQPQRSSIFQMLLGKGNSKSRASKSHNKTSGAAAGGEHATQPDSRAIIDDINRQTRLAMQYSKQLEAHLFRVEDLRAKYEMHLKMGLMVKSVSRAYLSNPYMGTAGAGQHTPGAQQHSPSSLGRPRRAHHLSSLVVNDSSSLGTTRSSLSSLNLSTWSFSRRQHSDRSSGPAAAAAATGEQLRRQWAESAALQQANGPSEMTASGALDDISCSSSLARQSQKYISTLSLDSVSKQRQSSKASGQLNLSKLISTSTSNNHKNSSRANKKQSQQEADVSNYCLDHEDQLLCHQHQQDLFYKLHGDDISAPGATDLPGACQCEILAQHQLVDSPISPVLPNSPHYHHQQSAQSHRLTPSSRPLSQYIYGTTAEFATPTTTGTLAASGGDIFYGTGAIGGGGGGALGALHKSASHSSLKKPRGSASNRHSALLYPAANGSKTTIKEFIDNIERIEAELESYMGSFLMNIEDIQGFARVCQGDVFEINIRYGHTQKFKTKISVLKDNRQKCDHKQTVFKARISDVIAIKAYECKGLGKKVLLGHKLCETRDLFVARSQLMTISLNQTGSIKLNLVITWNPLHMTPNSSLALQPGLDISHISLPPTPVSSSTLSSVSSAQSSTNGTATRGARSHSSNNNNHTTMINIHSTSNGGSGRRDKAASMVVVAPQNQYQQQQCSPTGVLATDGFAADANQIQYHYQHPTSEHQLKRVRSPKVYQEADNTFGYYIPEPDYLSSDLKY